MSGLSVHRFGSEPVIQLSPTGWTLAARQEQAAARIWSEATGDSSRHLTDDPILCVTRFGDTIEATPVPYRYYFAQQARPDLFPEPLVALAVTGILTCEGHFIVGRRADWVLQYPGQLELVPSGSVDKRAVSGNRIDANAQLTLEAEEELGIDRKLLSGQQVAGAIRDERNHTFDIVIRAQTHCSIDELLRARSRLYRPEYSELRTLTRDEFQRMIDDGSEQISAVSIAIFANFWAAPE